VSIPDGQTHTFPLMISAIVPAAGMSTRMGEQNKLLMTYRGKSLIEHAVDTLLDSRVSEIIVVAGFEGDKLKAALGGRPVTIIDNPDYREGMSTSIKAGLSAISHEATAIMIYLADQPMLQPSDVNQIIAAHTEAREAGKTIVVPFHQGQRGNPVIMDASFKGAIMDVAGDVGCRKVIKRNPDKVFIVEMETDHVIRDIDRMEDYEALA
jgi:molybdenum cofactor cytidylyltransferase